MSTAVEAAAVAVAVTSAVVVIAWPFLAPQPGAPEQAMSVRDRERLALLERRDAAYGGLRDLEQDHRTGKVGNEDYEAERRRLRADAAQALRGLDQLDSEPQREED